MSNEKKEWTYETKCRRCGCTCNWKSRAIEHIDFRMAVIDKIQNPFQLYCRVCEKHTVQEVVSYELNGDCAKEN